jgi:metallo-beta-lactamase class B
VTLCIATHWHSDRTDGLEYYKQQGIKTYTTLLTDKLSKENNKKRAEFLMTKDSIFNVGQYSFEVYYPGEGHTVDNIVVWFSKEKILYGGCLIKGAAAENLGYLGDANAAEYETTLKKVQKKCRNPKFIIVSHHDWNNINSLKHSIKLARKLKKKLSQILGFVQVFYDKQISPKARQRFGRTDFKYPTIGNTLPFLDHYKRLPQTIENNKKELDEKNNFIHAHIT